MAGVAKYSLEIKPSAGKELDAVDNALFARIDQETSLYQIVCTTLA